MKKPKRPIERWFVQYWGPDWKKETREDRTQIKRLFLQLLLFDCKYPEFRRGISQVFPGDSDKQRKLLEIRRRWIVCPQINCIKLVLMNKQKRRVMDSFDLRNRNVLAEFEELQTTRIQRTIRRIIKIPEKPPTWDQQESIVRSVLSDLRPRLMAHSRRKLTFVVRSNRITHDDIVSELNCKIIENVRWYYPTQTYAHTINSSFQAAKNYAINMIKFHTAEKRKLLLYDPKEGFYHRHVLIEDSGLAEKMDNGTSPMENHMAYRRFFDAFPASDHAILVALLDSTECPQSDILERDAEIAQTLKVTAFRVAALRFLLYRKFGDDLSPHFQGQ